MSRHRAPETEAANTPVVFMLILIFIAMLVGGGLFAVNSFEKSSAERCAKLGSSSQVYQDVCK